MKTPILSTLLFLSLSTARLVSQTDLAGNGSASNVLNSVRAAQAPGFVENRGQWNPGARFLLQGAGYNCWVGSNAILYDIYDVVREQDGEHRRGTAVRMEFVGAGSRVTVAGETERDGYKHYIVGNDPSRWAENVHEYNGVTISNLYDGIDMKMSVEGGQPRYDLVVADGADPSAISIRYSGGEGMQVDSEGDLVIGTMHGDVRHRHPIAYQVIGGVRVPVEARFIQAGNGTIGFRVGEYDRSRPLVIDPVISSRVFAGGMRDGAYGMVVDNSGRAYLCGWSYSPFYPTTPGSYDTSLNNDSLSADAVVMKINTATMAIEYSTFIGGERNDVATGVALDEASGEVVVCGESKSDGFPTTANAFQRVHSGAGTSDAFVLRLGANGSTLPYSTFLGGGRDDRANRVVLDPNGRIYLCGSTTSGNFPASPTSVDPTYGSAQAPFYTDAFVAMIDPSNGAAAATYLGSDATDEATDLALSRDGNSVIVVGGSWSPDFPSTIDAVQAPRPSGSPANQDAFISVFNLNLDALLYSTLLGGSQRDIANAVSVTPAGSLLVAGETQSRNFPATLRFDSLQINVQAPDIFVTEIDLGQRDLSGHPSVVTSVSGGTGSDVPYDVMCGQNGERWVVGVTASVNMPVTSDAYQRQHSDSASYDCFLMQFDSASHNVVYSTYLGGNEDDFAFASAIDPQGVLYVAGVTASSNYPITTAPYSFNTPGKTGAFLTRFAKTASVALPPVRNAASAAISVAVREHDGHVEIALTSNDGRPHLVTAILYDLQGRPVQEMAPVTTGSLAARVDCGELASGTYMVQMIVDRQQVLARPILVVR